MEKQIKLLFDIYNRQTAQVIRDTQNTYLAYSKAEGKGVLVEIFKVTYPELYNQIAAIKKKTIGGRATVTAQRIFLSVFGRFPFCPICKEAKIETLKQDRPLDFKRTCCSTCANLYKFEKTKEATMKAYGTDNIFKTKYFADNRIRFLQEKYGDDVTGPLKVPGAMDKVKQTSLDNWGTDHFSRSPIIRDKKATTCLNRFGSISFLGSKEGQLNLKTIILKDYGVDHISKAPEIKKQKKKKSDFNYSNPEIRKNIFDKTRSTYLKNYGVTHPSLLPEIQAKMQKHRTKDGVWREHPIKYQGDELKVLSSLENRKTVLGIKPWGREAPIKYKVEGKFHSYFPDWIIKDSEGKIWILEVKSSWTLLGGPKGIHYKINKAKFKAAEKFAKEQGFEFIVAVTTNIGIAWARNPSRALKTRLKQSGALK